jgi:hypothetical protein
VNGPAFHCDDPACDRCYADALDYELYLGLVGRRDMPAAPGGAGETEGPQ